MVQFHSAWTFRHQLVEVHWLATKVFLLYIILYHSLIFGSSITLELQIVLFVLKILINNKKNNEHFLKLVFINRYIVFSYNQFKESNGLKFLTDQSLILARWLLFGIIFFTKIIKLKIWIMQLKFIFLFFGKLKKSLQLYVLVKSVNIFKYIYIGISLNWIYF